eukprot:gene14269-14419_t
MDVEEMQLEEQRAASTLEQRLLSGRLTPLERLTRMASMPDLKLMRRSPLPLGGPNLGHLPRPLTGSGDPPGALPVRISPGRPTGSMTRTLTATF